MELTGTIKLIKKEQKISEKFSKREFIIETSEKYPQLIQLELQGDKCDLIEPYTIGEEILCSLNIRGRAWENPQGETKYFNTITVWKIQNSNGQQNDTKTYSKSENKKEDDDLPF